MAKKRIRNSGPFMDNDAKAKSGKKSIKDKDADKNRFVTKGSDLDKKQLKAFEAEINHMNMNMVDFYGKGKNWLQNNKNRTQGASFSAFNDVYQRRMLLMCMMPLQRGVSMSSISQSVGLVVGMALINKDFRENLHKAYANFKMQKLGGPAEYVAHIEKDSKLVAKIDKHLAASNGGRIPFTEQSASAMNIALAKQAYEAYRDPNQNKEDVTRNYQNAKEMLYELAKADGISKEDLDRGTNIMFTRLAEENPDMKLMYSETAYNKVVKGSPERDTYKTLDKDGNEVINERNVWNGKYIDLETQEEFDGTFDVREPMNIEDFNDKLKNDISSNLKWVEPKDFDKTANALLISSLKAKGENIRETGEYDEKLSEHLGDYISMGHIDNLKEFGDFNNMRESVAYYKSTGDKSKMGMAEAYYVAIEESLNEYAKQSSEHAKALEAWQEKIKNKEFDFQNDFKVNPEKETETEAEQENTHSNRRAAYQNFEYDDNEAGFEL